MKKDRLAESIAAKLQNSKKPYLFFLDSDTSGFFSCKLQTREIALKFFYIFFSELAKANDLKLEDVVDDVFNTLKKMLKEKKTTDIKKLMKWLDERSEKQ